MAKNRFFVWKRPSFLLGFGILGIIICFLLFWGWEFYWPDHLLLGRAAPEIKNWPLTIGLFTAVLGWMVSSWVTIRNSIKQHTINTLLQSRLSAHYMGHVDVLNQLFEYFRHKNLDEADIKTDTFLAKKSSVIYVLNYLEFIAVGVRHGDLHEILLRSTIRRIVVRNYEFFSAYITDRRASDQRVYEHLTALYIRWKDPSPDSKPQ